MLLYSYITVQYYVLYTMYNIYICTIIHIIEFDSVVLRKEVIIKINC